MRKFLQKSWLDVRYGLHSGFPPCCVAFYVTAWRAAFGGYSARHGKEPGRPFIDWYWRQIEGVHGDLGIGYIPCPLCLARGAKVRVHKCTDKCRYPGETRRLHRESE